MILRQELLMIPRQERVTMEIKDLGMGGDVKFSWTVGLPVFKSRDPRMGKKRQLTVDSDQDVRQC